MLNKSISVANLSANDSLVSFLEKSALHAGRGVTFIGSAGEEFLSYADLRHAALGALYHLQQAGLNPNDELLIQTEDNKALLVILWACMMGNIIPVPLAAGRVDDHRLKVFRVYEAMNNAHYAADKKLFSSLAAFATENGLETEFKEIDERYISVDRLLETVALGTRTQVRLHDTGYIQFSSGSTGAPKGVELTHHNLLTNCIDILNRSESSPEDVFLSWMPLTHDMGLICFHFCAVIASAQQYIIPTDLFVRRPLLWFDKASAHKATQLYSPNFGYQYVMNAMEGLPPQPWDLSAVRIIYNGAEPISYSLCRRFIKTMSVYGLKENAIFPGYGLAEASVAVSLPTVGDDIKEYKLARNHLNIGDTIQQIVDEDAYAVSFVETGHPIEHCQVRICDDHGRVLEDDTIGHIQLSGGNVTKGYYNNKKATRDVMTADGWLRTGDLGFMHAGRLVITGRAKNMIIINGQNYYPQDIEKLIFEKLPEFSTGKAVACSVRNPSLGVEELVVFLLFKGPVQDFVPHVKAVKEVVLRQAGIPVAQVLPLKKIPKTTSGKIQYYKLSEEFAQGYFHEAVTAINNLLSAEEEQLLNDQGSVEERLTAICKAVTGSAQPDLIAHGLNSITATRIASRIQQHFSVKITLQDVFDHPTLDAMAAFIRKAAAIYRMPIHPVEEQEYYSASQSQKRFWLLQQMDESQVAYNLNNAIAIQGKFNVEVFDKAVNLVAGRYEILRTAFFVVDGEVKQKVQEASSSRFKTIVEDLSMAPAPGVLARKRIARLQLTPFDLSTAPLFRFQLFITGPDQYYLSFSIHHIITDGWSVGLFIEQLHDLYHTLLNGVDAAFHPLPLQFKDFAAWQLRQAGAEHMRQSRDYWRNELQGELPVVELPICKPRKAVQTFRGGAVNLSLGGALSRRLEAFCNDRDITLFTALVSAVSVLLHRYTRQQDIIVGTDSAGRTLPELEEQMGYFLNTLPLIISIQEADDFNAVLAKAKRKLSLAMENQEYPFDSMVEDLGLKRDKSRTPVFDILVLFQNLERSFNFSKLLPGAEVAEISTDVRTSIVDLEFEFIYRHNILCCDVKYNADLYEHAQVARLAGHFCALLEAAIQDPAVAVGAYNLLHGGELQELQQFSRGASRIDTVESCIDRFEKQAALRPAKTALCFESVSLTYEQLNAEVNRLANFLLENGHVQVRDRVGLLLQRSEHMIIALLAVLKAGACYIPIDPEYPAERINYICENSKLNLLLVDDHTLKAHQPVANNILSIDAARSLLHQYSTRNIPYTILPSHKAYILYTSGTTGKPKGVIITHSSLTDYIVTFQQYFNLQPDDTVIQQSSLSFDVSVEEIFPILCAGGTLVVAKDGARDVEALLRLVESKQATVLSTTPFVISELNQQPGRLASLRLLISGGDVLKPSFIDKLYDRLALYNTYGPTEATVCASYHRVQSLHDVNVIGKPLPNHSVYIVDEQMRLAPKGVPGEICISGNGVALGYLDLAAGTRNAFVANPFEPGTWLYKTGDTGVWLEDGEIKFLGRKDTQFKWRGYRIEPVEIEKALTEHEDVQHALALLWERGSDSMLAAYFIANKPVDIASLRLFMAERLPYYMVPAKLVQVPAFAQSENGKIETKQLPNPFDLDEEENIAAATGIELEMVRLWQELLGNASISVTENFFAAGGQSIKATTMLMRIEQAFGTRLNMRDIFLYPTPRQLCGLIASLKNTAADHISPVGSRPYYPLSFGQQRLWVLHQFNKQQLGYNLAWTFTIEGADAATVRQAFRMLAERHESLRTSFGVGHEGPVQLVHDYADEQLPFYCESVGDTTSGATVLYQDARMPFNLEKGPLYRVRLCSLSDRLHLAGFTIHHIIADGWSMEVLSMELNELLNALQELRAPVLPALRIQQKDFAVWQQQYFNSGPAESHRQYWLNRFADGIPVVELPGCRPRPLALQEDGDTLRVPLPPQLMQQLRQLGATVNASLFMCVTALLKALFFKYTGQQDMVIGTPVSGRQHADLENQVGYYLNLLPLRTSFSRDGSFTDLLKLVRQTIMEAQEHQDYPVDKLIDVLQLPGNNNRLPFFDKMVVFQEFEHRAIQLMPGSGKARILELEEVDTNTSIGDLLFEFNRLKGDWLLKIRFNTHLYDAAQIARLANHFVMLAKAVAADATRPLHSYNMLAVHEYEQVLGFSEGKKLLPAQGFVNVVELFERQAALRGNAVAARLHGQSFTYSEIDGKAVQLAHCLVHKLGVTKAQVVGVHMQRTEKAIISLLAIMKAGAAWLPLDPEYPAERVMFMIEDSGAGVVITDSLFDELLPAMHSVNGVERVAWPQLNGADLAYVMYTSGSTGRPKGVLVSHASLGDYVSTFSSYYSLNHHDRVIQQSSLSFDVCIEEIFPVLCSGGTLLLLPEGGRNIGQLLHVITTEQATVLSTTPLVINELNEQAERLHSLRILISGGDSLMPSHVSRLVEHTNVYNTYGPTEATVCASYHKLAAAADAPVIGQPVYNKNIYILDEQLQPVPVGVPGEMFIAGAGLALGYLKLEQETAQRFIDCPFTPGKMYRTGDMACWREDGSIQFLGRMDEQVKVRGYRVELSEIEHVISEHAAIRKVLVLARKDDNNLAQLAAFYQERMPVDVAQLRHWLTAKLPGYMVPAFLVPLEEFPLLPNGKIDQRALMQWPLQEPTQKSAAPVTACQLKLAGIWKKILQKEQVGIHDNFFSLGGHSIRATRMVSLIAGELGVEIGLQHVFQYPTIASLAEIIEQAATASPLIQPIARQHHYSVSNAQQRLWILHQFREEQAAYNITWARKLHGKLDKQLLEQAFLLVIQRHETLRTSVEEVNGTLRQFIKDAGQVSFGIQYHDLSAHPRGSEEALRTVRSEQSAIFDLSTAPLLRVSLIKLQEQQHLLVVNMHHIVSDGWSVQVLADDVTSIYNALAHGKEPALSPLGFHYKDYAAFIGNEYAKPSFDAHRNYWLRQLQDAPALDLPADYVRPAVKTTKGSSCNYVIDALLVARLNKLAVTEGVSAYMILLAALKLLCYRYTGQQDIVVGSPVSGREFAGLEKQVGFYVNTLALRTQLDAADDLLTLLRKVKATCTAAYAHQLFPFDMLVEALQLQRDLSRSPLFDVMLTMHQDMPDQTGSMIDGVEISAFPLESVTSKFDLSLNVFPGAEWQLVLEYNTDLFSRRRMELLLVHFHNILLQIAEHPLANISSFEYISAEEKEIWRQFNNTAVAYHAGYTSILEHIANQAAKQAARAAVYYGDTTVTYELLHEESNRMAHALLKKWGVQPGDLVGLFMNRTEKMIISLLAVLKTGAAYVPIDPLYPRSRVEYMIRDCGAKLIITEKELANLLGDDQPAYCIEDFMESRTDYLAVQPQVTIEPGSAAYVIYTSGSTGRPKGVVITHANVLAFVHWAMDEFAQDGFEIVYAATSYCFDLSIFELLFTLCAGKRLRLLQSGLEIAPYLQHDRQVLINTVPSVVENLLKEQTDLSAVVTLNMAGEPIPVSVAKQLDCVRMKVRNLYGPSEDTTYSTCYRLNKGDEHIPIGRPIANTRIYITDSCNNLVPPGVPGEICIAGDGLAKEYLDMPELTAEKFAGNMPGESRVYKTGDLGRLLYNGMIEFLGRRDNQVKIRGYRIETGEIESLLSAYAGVEKSLVLVSGSAADKLLVAYYTSTEQLVAERLAAHLRAFLPEYMVPQHFVWLPAFPLTPNGKIDRGRLPDAARNDVNETILPRTMLETQLSNIWKEVLGKEGFGVGDNFFRLGGHSLKAVQVVSRINKQLSIATGLRDVFACPTIEKLALLLQQRKEAVAEKPYAVEEQEYYAASPAQQRLWVLHQLDGGNPVYNMPGAYLIEGRLNANVLESAYRQLIMRHEILRTTFRVKDGKLVQCIQLPEEVAFNLEPEDMRLLAGTTAVVNDIIRAEVLRTFDLERGPLLRVRLLQVEDQMHYLIVTLHHIVSDGWSMEVIMQEILALYDGNPLAPMQFQYKDYAVARQREAGTNAFDVQRRYWLQQLGGELPVLELPTGKTRPAKKTYNGRMLKSQPDLHLAQKVRTFAEQTNSSVFTVLSAAFNVLLYRYTQQHDIITGTAVAGRKKLELENQVGFYVNTLAVRTAIDGTRDFSTLVSTVNETLMNAYEHQDYPFDTLVEELNIPRDLGRSPIFDIMLLMQQSALQQSPGIVPGLQYRELEVPHESVKFDLTVLFKDTADGLVLQVQYNTDVFTRQWVDRLLSHYFSLLACCLLNKHTALNELDYLLMEEKAKLLHDFNNTYRPVPEAETLVSLFEQQALKTPDAKAVVFNEQFLTYRQLNERSGQLAAYLLRHFTVAPDDRIGLMLDRSADLMVGIFGILKAGAAYVPIDPAYPGQRIAYMMQDSGIGLLLTDRNIDALENITVIRLQDAILQEPQPAPSRARPSGLAYVIYTSGSTGQPKGAMIEHRSVVNLCCWLKELIYDKYASPLNVLLTASVSFDSSVKQLFPPLVCGSTLVLLPEGVRKDPAALRNALAKHSIDVWDATPSYLAHFLSFVKDELPAIKFTLAGGEPIKENLVSRYYEAMGPGSRLVNVYGVTEATVDSTFEVIEPHTAFAASIGRPLHNTTIYILDANRQLLPEGVPGEICIAGKGVGRGYLNRTALTEQKFVNDPFHAGRLMYCTGDVGVWLPGGRIAFRGRSDRQVKIRGYRIEPGEIEHCIQAQPGVKQCLVLARKDNLGEEFLTAYINCTGEPSAVNTASLKQQLAATLPAYMVPAFIIALKQFPLTAHGKIDQRALPLPEASTDAPEQVYVGPRTLTEKTIAGIFQATLGVGRCGVTDNFFELGGHSLKAILIAGSIAQELNVAVSPDILFQYPTVEELATYIDTLKPLLFTGYDIVSDNDTNFEEITL